MYARVEVAVRPEYLDSAAQNLLRQIEFAHPEIRKRIRWARLLDVYWIDMSLSREQFISAITEICWDKVIQWVFTGNLMPAAAGKSGGLQDLIELSPHRPGKFWGIERRLRAGVTDHAARTLLEAFEILAGHPLPEARASSGSLLLLEGLELTEDSLATIARNVACNELIETWNLVPEESLRKNDRFHQERVKYDLPKMALRGSEEVETVDLNLLKESELENLSTERLWALSLAEMKAIQSYFSKEPVQKTRAQCGLSSPTDVELEILAQTWSEHCKHKIMNATIHYREEGPKGTKTFEIKSLFRTMIAGATAQIQRPWLLSVFQDNAGICALDDEDAFCIKVETHNSPSALDPYGGALTGIVGVNRDILGCGLGARPIFNTNVFCVAPSDYQKPLPERLLHPRRILEGVRRGVEHGGNKSGIPTVNGALVFDESYLGKPLIYCGTAGMMPRKIGPNADKVPCEEKKILPGDRVMMVGGRIGKDGIHGATFSSLALQDSSPTSAVQLGDPLTQKRMSDFLIEARDQGLYRAITDNGAGGLSSSVGEMAQLSGGARIDVALAKTKYPGLKPYERMISESQERMTLAVPLEKKTEFMALAERRAVEICDLGEFNQSGNFEILYEDKTVALLDLDFLHRGLPELKLKAEWKIGPGSLGEPTAISAQSVAHQAGQKLLDLLSRPNICSKEWMIRQYDHEVQGTSVIKPLHTVGAGTPGASSGPNDGAVVQAKLHQDVGLAVGCGIQPRLSAFDPFLMAQASVDEAIRNILCVGAEYGTPECVVALVDNFGWPDPTGDPRKMGALVRASLGLKDSVLALEVPLVSGKDSMKNDFKGSLEKETIQISAMPTLLMTAVAKLSDMKQARTADFKLPGDLIYLLGPGVFGLLGSEFHALLQDSGGAEAGEYGVLQLPHPQWDLARLTYSWMGGKLGKTGNRLRSAHDVSDGGLLVAVAECLLAHGYGAQLSVESPENPWEFLFGEGFHTFVVSLGAEDMNAVEADWNECKIPFRRLGTVQASARLQVSIGNHLCVDLGVPSMRSAWMKEGFWS